MYKPISQIDIHTVVKFEYEQWKDHSNLEIKHKICWLGGTMEMLSLDNIFSPKSVANGLLQICPRIQPSILGFTNDNFEEYPHDFLYFYEKREFHS